MTLPSCTGFLKLEVFTISHVLAMEAEINYLTGRGLLVHLLYTPLQSCVNIRFLLSSFILSRSSQVPWLDCFNTKIMAEFNRKLLILIISFWICVPTLDMVSDMTMVIKLFKGPQPDLILSGGECIC